jgi:hypothetical protein
MKHIPDRLWCEIEKLIPKKRISIGRPEFDNRKTFEGIVLVLKTGVRKEHSSCSISKCSKKKGRA